jgi:thiamine transport system substrate-binding protein
MERKIMDRILLVSLLLLAACAPGATATPSSTEPQTITVMTHDSFSVSETVVKSFEEANNARVVFLQSGDAGSVLNRAILTKDAPLADVLFGVDNTFLSRALEAGIFEAYESPALSAIPAAFKLDPSNQALPVDYGDVCINYDKA